VTKAVKAAGLVVLLGAGILMGLYAPPARADFEAGWRAYQRGDFSGALESWRPLADAGDARAQFNIGVMYDEGRGVALDRVQAIRWWTKAAGQGDAEAQHNLALAMIDGSGIGQDYDKAVF